MSKNVDNIFNFSVNTKLNTMGTLQNILVLPNNFYYYSNRKQ